MNILEMRDISKSFNGVNVLSGVSLEVGAGEIHALLGENGAGKSTLMNILTGVLQADRGTIYFDGQEVQHNSIRKSESLGIGFVHQELNLFNDLKVYENIFLGKELVTKTGRLRKSAMIAQARELFLKLGVTIDATALVKSLSTSEKQLLEICKSLFFDVKLLILDEPTTALNNEEIEKLFQILQSLKAQGKSFIIISHKMPEIFMISDSYTVLRNGRFVKRGLISQVSPEEVTRYMVGDSYSESEDYCTRTLGEPVLTCQNYTGDGFRDVNLTVRKGEILALTGLQGSGGDKLMECIFGLCVSTSGTLKVHGKKVEDHTVRQAMRRGIGLLPANRKENSIIKDMSILENMYISEHVLSAKRIHIHKKKEIGKYQESKQLLNIRAADYNNPIVSLSGGNQQKVMFARWLNTNADILLLENPTQGIDVGAKAEIYRLILELAKSGKTILINTLEIPEIQKVADRCAIFYEGSITTILNHDEINEHMVMMYSTNAINAEEK